MNTPFHKPINVRTLPKSGRQISYIATQDECKLIAKQNDLYAVVSFGAFAELRPWKGEGVSVRGKIDAQIVQPCAVTAESLETEVKETFDLTFVPAASKLARWEPGPDSEVILDAMEDDLPDTFSGDSIDLAEIWMEFFTLGLDPFLKADGAKLPENAGETGGETQNSPFSQLKSLKLH